MSVDFDGAFIDSVFRRWEKLSPEQQEKASTDRHGQLRPVDPDTWALYDTKRYQRGHVDVFRAVYEKSHHPPKGGERLLVVDIGSGAATVAVALSEMLEPEQRTRIDYRAFDPHPTMRKMGEQILEKLNAGFGSVIFCELPEEVFDFVPADRLLLTFSYVAHQDSVKRSDVAKWAQHIKRAIGKVKFPVELIYTTADIPEKPDRLKELKLELRKAGIEISSTPVDVAVKQRSFGCVKRNGKVGWNQINAEWKTIAEHWVLGLPRAAPPSDRVKPGSDLFHEVGSCPPEGFEYHPDFLSCEREQALLKEVNRDDVEWITELARRTQHFGYTYDYNSRGLNTTNQTEPLPRWLEDLASEVREIASEDARRWLDEPFKQAIINEYKPGQGIAPHIDSPAFGPVVATVSLGSGINMDFNYEPTGATHTERLEPRSLVLLYGDSRYKWRHGIRKRKTDIWNSFKIPRQLRVSITFRQV